MCSSPYLLMPFVSAGVVPAGASAAVATAEEPAGSGDCQAWPVPASWTATASVVWAGRTSASADVMRHFAAEASQSLT